MAHRSGVHCLRSRDTRLRDALQRVAALQRKAEGEESALLKLGLKTSLVLEVSNHRIINHPQVSHNSPIILPKIAKCMGCTLKKNTKMLLVYCCFANKKNCSNRRKESPFAPQWDRGQSSAPPATCRGSPAASNWKPLEVSSFLNEIHF